jgi:hypothetical protein
MVQTKQFKLKMNPISADDTWKFQFTYESLTDRSEPCYSNLDTFGLAVETLPIAKNALNNQSQTQILLGTNICIDQNRLFVSISFDGLFKPLLY